MNQNLNRSFDQCGLTCADDWKQRAIEKSRQDILRRLEQERRARISEFVSRIYENSDQEGTRG